MELLNCFLSRKQTTAKIAKERLQIIVAEQRRSGKTPNYLPQLKCDLLKVLCKYISSSPELLSVQLEIKKGDISLLEVNVMLPEAKVRYQHK
ncbi:cell division topological specificity factor MinE, partial [Candidatus Palibaumannia cicadellinicola]